MTENQVRLVQETLQMVLANTDGFGDRFYETLFRLDPKLKDYFSPEIEVQQKKLVSALHLLVSGMSATSEVGPQISKLGVAHAGMGLQPQHFTTFGMALLMALRDELGADFTVEVRNAWTSAYQVMSSQIQDAMDQRQAS